MAEDLGMLHNRFRDVQQHIATLLSGGIAQSRRDLLIAGMITLIISVTGAVPTKLEALGVEFTAIEQRYFFAIAGLIVLYFLVKFSLQNVESAMSIRLLQAEARSILWQIHELNDKRRQIHELHDKRRQIHELYYERTSPPIKRRLNLPLLYIYLGSVIIFDTAIPLLVGAVSLSAAFYAAVVGHSIVQRGLPAPAFGAV